MRMNIRLFLFVYALCIILLCGIKLGESKKKNEVDTVATDSSHSSGKPDKLNKKGNLINGSTVASKKEKKKKEESQEEFPISAMSNGGDKGNDDNGLWSNTKTGLMKGEHLSSSNNNNQQSMNSEETLNKNTKGNEKKKDVEKEEKDHFMKLKNIPSEVVVETIKPTKGESNEEEDDGHIVDEQNLPNENIKSNSLEERYKEHTKTNKGKEESVEENKKENAYQKEGKTEEPNKSFLDGNNSNEEPPDDNHNNPLYQAMKSPYSDQDIVYFFKNHLKDSFFNRNGLDFSVTSVYLYNQYVNANEHVSLKLKEGEDRMIILVTGNKLFFNDLINSKEKEIAIRKKYVFLMNQLIKNLKTYDHTKNFTYNYLFRTDPVSYDSNKKLVDYELLGELSQTTQTIYLDESKKKRVSMHKIYGGWFQYLGVLLVGGFNYVERNKPIPVEIIPTKYMNEFVRMVNEDLRNPNEDSIKLWRDFPNESFSVWRYSLELLMWDSFNKLPNELPHPGKFLLAYKEKYHGGKEIHRNKEPIRFHKEVAQNTGEKILNWHMFIQKVVEEEQGLELVIVSVDDYYKRINEPSEIAATSSTTSTVETRTDMNVNGYALLLLLNKDFFNDSFIYSENYQEAKKKNFFSKLVRILSKLQDVLLNLKELMDSDEDPRISVYNYLGIRERENYGKFDPHIIGDIAGVTKFLQCKDYMNEKNCFRDVSMHYKYGGWYEFGGLIHVKNVNYVSLTYEKHDILSKEEEKKIIFLANGELERTEFWRDLPDQDMTKFRYPLHVFLLENPEFHMKHLEKVHPFIFVYLIGKGYSNWNHKIDKSNALSTLSELYSFNENKSNAYRTMETKDGKKSNTSWINQNECVEGDQLCRSRSKEQSAYPSLLDLIGKNTHTERLDSSRENTFNSDSEEMEPDMDIDAMEGLLFGSDSLLGDLWKEELLENRNEKIQGDSLEQYDEIKEINDLYDYTEEKQNLEMLVSAQDEERNKIHHKLAIILIVGFVALILSILVIIGIKLYVKYVKNRIDTKNELVTSFKEKEEIPVVQGIPAPWLNA